MYDYYLNREENKYFANRNFIDIPAIGQKSFYGKAKFVKYKNGFIGCLSYDTIVCIYNPNTGEFYKTWNNWSATTAKHINSFLAMFGLPKLTKKQWFELPIKDKSKQVYTVGYSNGIIHGRFEDFTTSDYNKALNFVNSWQNSASACLGYNFYVVEV